jgi:integrase
MRPKSSGKDLPPRMLRRTKHLKDGVWVGYYYNGRTEDGRRVEIPLGTDLAQAKLKWAELETKPPPTDTTVFAAIFDRYEREVIPQRASRTQRDYRDHLKQLRAAFGEMHVDELLPKHVAQYRDARSAKVRANREIATLSSVFNYAREWGLTDRQNPVRGVKKNRETPRDVYVDDEIWRAVYEQANQTVRDAMDLAYLTGQRPADVRGMRAADVRGDYLEVRQRKTGAKLRILLSENGQRTELGRVVDRIQSRRVVGLYLLGTLIPESTFCKWFRAARSKAIAAAGDNADLAARIGRFEFRDLRSKAASDTDLASASKLLGHTEQEITRDVYRRKGDTVRPVR